MSFSTLRNLPADADLRRLLETAERRWNDPAMVERNDVGHDYEKLSAWLEGDTDRTDEQEAGGVIESANSLAYTLGRKYPLVVVPYEVGLPGGMVEAGNGILGIGRAPVRDAYRAGARSVDELLAIDTVRRYLDHESPRLCYGRFVAGDGRMKPGSPEAMATVLLDLLLEEKRP